MGQPLGLGIGGEFVECHGHAGEPHCIQPVEGGMCKHVSLLQ